VTVPSDKAPVAASNAIGGDDAAQAPKPLIVRDEPISPAPHNMVAPLGSVPQPNLASIVAFAAFRIATPSTYHTSVEELPMANDMPAQNDPAIEAVAFLRAAMAENDSLARVEKTGATEEARIVETEMLLQCGSRWTSALTAMVATVPTTPAGLAAQAELLLHMETEWGDRGEIVGNENWLMFTKSVQLAAIGFGRCA
jgi:hypothetical protein